MGRRVVKRRPKEARLLVAVDFSPASRLALDAGGALAADLGAGIVLCHVTPPVPRKKAPASRAGRGRSASSPLDAALEDAARLSAKWAEELRADDLDVTAVNPIGAPAETLVATAKEHGCSALVLGTTGRGALHRLVLGSVAREVVRTSPLPVLLVPLRMRTARKPKARTAAPAPARQILVATDFSDDAERAFDAAVGLAKDLKCLVRALHVVPLAEPAPFPYGAEYTVELVEAEEESSLGQLGLLATRARRSQVSVVPAIQLGHPPSVILAEARTTGASLIVLGTHGGSASRQFFLGSVAQAVVQHADRPVLVVPPAKGPARGTWRA